MISMASRVTFGGLTFATFNAKNIAVVVAVMISPSLIESSNQNYSFIVYIFSTAYDVVLVVDPVFY